MRPDNRPKYSYAPDQILDLVEKHFITEGNPKCMIATDRGERCVYTHTGCAVGCLLTMEDAEAIDPDIGKLSLSGWYQDKDTDPKLREIWNVYFGHFVQTPWILQKLQYAHDRDGDTKENIREAIGILRGWLNG